MCQFSRVKRRSRLFALAEYLRGRRTGVTAAELATRFDVTLRTIYRDLDALRDAALPVRADRGRGGGYALDRGYTLPPINLTPREAAVMIALGRLATELRLLPFVDTLQSGLDKVRGALSTSAQRELLTLLEGLEYTGVPSAPVAPAVRRATHHQHLEQSIHLHHAPPSPRKYAHSTDLSIDTFESQSSTHYIQSATGWRPGRRARCGRGGTGGAPACRGRRS